MVDFVTRRAPLPARARYWTVIAWGSMTNVPAGLSNVIAIAAGEEHHLALIDVTPPKVSAPIRQPRMDSYGRAFRPSSLK
jgi:hypothetical protein